MGPLLLLSWLTLAVFDPDPGGGNHVVAIGYFLGSLFAHAALAAFWAAFGRGPLAWRFPLSIVWTASLPIAVGINIGLNNGPGDAVVVIGGCLLGQWLALQFPFWALRLELGLHLRHSDDGGGEADAAQLRFGIRHLLFVMLITGVVLGVGRVAVANIDISGNREIIIFVFLAVAAIIVTVPLLLSALMRRMAALGVLLALLFMSVVTAWELPLLDRIGGSGPKAGDFLAINFASAGLILVSALVVRLNGYCLYARGSVKA